ncbi:MAG: hypothetical protein KDA89_20330 [Planctomycetaceae bacterium]|nr:hypothetical protein [Planctomycetaceae bacterium]
MSTVFQTCPGCDSVILADTTECPQCGHVFDEERAGQQIAAEDRERRKYQELFDTCPKCGEQVRSGLVRCWSCNGFMRADVEAKYKEMTNRPQPIIFSDIPKDQRTEYIPSREGQVFGGYGRDVFDAEGDDADFTLNMEERPAPAAAGSGGKSSPSGPTKAPVADGPDAPREKTPEKTEPKKEKLSSQTPKAEIQAINLNAAPAPAGGTDAKPAAAAPGRPPQDSAGDDLLNIAMRDQAETRRRQREKIQESRRRRILMPCSCGAWIRVTEDQAGRTLRCKQCKKPFIVPEMRRREKTEKSEGAVGPNVSVRWFENIHLHVITPTDVVLKPGSLEKSFVEVDAAFFDNTLHIVRFATPAKKSLFGKGTDGPPAVEQQRTEIRQHVQKTGAFANLPHVDLVSISAAQSGKIRLVQPIAEVHQSMFAGVPVFGEGKVVLYLPADSDNGNQMFVSLPLSVYRRFADDLQKSFNLTIPAKENGVPGQEAHDQVVCHLSEVKIPAAKHVEYYRDDPGFDVELSGYICGTCGIAFTEDARARKKLGGATAKGLPKAKCPKCSNKFGDQQLFKVTAKTVEEDDAGETTAPAPSSPASGPQTGDGDSTPMELPKVE